MALPKLIARRGALNAGKRSTKILRAKICRNLLKSLDSDEIVRDLHNIKDLP
jgi:hypothetical protein